MRGDGWQCAFGSDGTAVVLRGAEHVHDAAERGLAHGHVIGLPVGLHGEAALQTFGGAHRDGAHHAVAELLLHFEREVHVGELERFGKICGIASRGEFDVDDGADDLGDFAVAISITSVILWRSSDRSRAAHDFRELGGDRRPGGALL